MEKIKINNKKETKKVETVSFIILPNGEAIKREKGSSPSFLSRSEKERIGQE